MNARLTRNSCRFGLGAITLMALLWFPVNAFAGEPMYLHLNIASSYIIGDSQVTTLDRQEDTVVYSFGYELNTPREASTGRVTGRRQHGALKIVKAVNSTSPLLYMALCENQPVEARLRFFRYILLSIDSP